MKGAVFTNFQEMVEDQFGMECWETLLEKSDLPSEGIYTSSETYDDQEILSLVVALSEYSSVPVPDLVEAFGRYLYTGLTHSLPPSMRARIVFTVLRKEEDIFSNAPVAQLDRAPPPEGEVEGSNTFWRFIESKTIN